MKLGRHMQRPPMAPLGPCSHCGQFSHERSCVEELNRLLLAAHTTNGALTAENAKLRAENDALRTERNEAVSAIVAAGSAMNAVEAR